MIKFLQKRKSIKNASILLTGPVRNVEDIIENEIKILEVLSNLKKITLIFNIYRLANYRKKLRNRTERIARACNEIVKQVMSNPKYRHIDFIMMADLDDMNNLV